jgi:hypothetical protein
LLNALRCLRDNPAMPHDFHRHDVIVIGGGRGGKFASHGLACRGAHGQGWPGWGFRSRKSGAMEGSHTMSAVINRIYQAQT